MNCLNERAKIDAYLEYGKSALEISKLVGVIYNYKTDPAKCTKKFNIKSNPYLTE